MVRKPTSFNAPATLRDSSATGTIDSSPRGRHIGCRNSVSSLGDLDSMEPSSPKRPRWATINNSPSPKGSSIERGRKGARNIDRLGHNDRRSLPTRRSEVTTNNSHDIIQRAKQRDISPRVQERRQLNSPWMPSRYIKVSKEHSESSQGHQGGDDEWTTLPRRASHSRSTHSVRKSAKFDLPAGLFNKLQPNPLEFSSSPLSASSQTRKEYNHQVGLPMRSKVTLFQPSSSPRRSLTSRKDVSRNPV